MLVFFAELSNNTHKLTFRQNGVGGGLLPQVRGDQNVRPVPGDHDQASGEDVHCELGNPASTAGEDEIPYEPAQESEEKVNFSPILLVIIL